MNRQTAHPRGMALLLVVTVLAVVAVLGTALLSASSIQIASVRTSILGAQAASLADSGVQLAAYNLQYPMKATGYSGTKVWQGVAGYSLGTGAPGTLSVSVARAGDGFYNVTSTARVCSGAGGTIDRTIQAQLQVSTGSMVGYAVGFASDVALPNKVVINGNVQANKNLTTSGQINGNVFYGESAGTSGSGAISGTTVPLDGGSQWPVPSWGNLRDYSGAYVYNGQVYQATEITASTLGSNTVLGPTPGNPAGIYYRKGSLTTSHYLTVNGTLIVDGILYVGGGYSTITPVQGFPALIMKGDMYLKGSGAVRDLTVNGTSWLQGNMRSSGSVPTGFFRFNGSLMVANGGVDSAFGGTVYINYDPNRPTAPDLDRTQPPMGVKMVWWKQ